MSTINGDIITNITVVEGSATSDCNTVTGNVNIIQPKIVGTFSNFIPTWDFYAINWSVKPFLITSITDGKVYGYTLSGVTRYRFVPNTYDPTLDSFYSGFDGANLTELIITRG